MPSQKTKKGGAKYKPSIFTKKHVRNMMQVAKRKRQLQHIADSMKKKQSKMVDELADMFSTSFVISKSPTKKSHTKSHTKSHKKSHGITKKSHKKVSPTKSNNIANLFGSMKMGIKSQKKKSLPKMSHHNQLIAVQQASAVEARKSRTAETRRMTPYERAAARQSAMHTD